MEEQRTMAEQQLEEENTLQKVERMATELEEAATAEQLAEEEEQL